MGLWGLSVPASGELRIPLLKTQPPYCGHTVPGSGSLQLVETFRFSSGDTLVPQIQWITAGDMVILRPRNVAMSVLSGMHVSFFVKPFGDWPFELVCRNVPLTIHSGDVGIEAVSPGQPAGSVWRVELFDAQATEHLKLTSTFSIFRSPEHRDVQPQLVSEALSDASGLLCIRDGIVPTSKRSSAGFSGKIRLDITLADSDLVLTEPERGEITRLVLTAGSLWTQACQNCQIDQLAVIAVDGQTFIRRGLDTWYQEQLSSPRAAGSAAPPEALELSLKESLEPIQWLLAGSSLLSAPRSKIFTDYVPLSFDVRKDSSFCTRSVTQATAPTLARVQKVLCSSPLEPLAERARMLIRFSDGHTACGDSPNIIGCRADNELTEYNVRDYSFVFDAADWRTPPVGHGKIAVSLLQVLTHEMGHWIGLPHLGDSETIMASSLEMSRCINDKTIRALLGELGSSQAGSSGATVPLPFTYREVAHH